MRRWWVIVITSTFLLVSPQLTGGQADRARIGVRTVGTLEIAVYAWGPQDIVHPKGTGHPEPGELATHHLDVRVYDLDRGIYIPYLRLKAIIADVAKREEFAVELEPMIGEWIHYGANVILPHRGTYSILIDVQPPDIARYRHLADVWNTPAQAAFTYEYR